MEEKTILVPHHYVGQVFGYKAYKIIEDYKLSYNLGSATKYILRAGNKPYVNDDARLSYIADIKKAISHLNFELEALENVKN